MIYSLLTLDIDKRGVAHVTLNRPEVHNAFNAELIAELTSVFTALDADDTVRLAVLSGNGKSFCAGGDLKWMKSMKNFTREQNMADGARLAAMYERINRFGKPLIGMIHGVALGGGSGLAAVCDYVIAAEDAKFGFTETRVGIVPATISPYVIAKIGPGNARAWFLSGAQFSATQAKEMGLAHRVAPRIAQQEACDEAVAEFLRAGPHAVRTTKWLVDEISALIYSDNHRRITDLTVNAIADARVSAEGQEGMEALLTGRKPAWLIAP